MTVTANEKLCTVSGRIYTLVLLNIFLWQNWELCHQPIQLCISHFKHDAKCRPFSWVSYGNYVNLGSMPNPCSWVPRKPVWTCSIPPSIFYAFMSPMECAVRWGLKNGTKCFVHWSTLQERIKNYKLNEDRKKWCSCLHVSVRLFLTVQLTLPHGVPSFPNCHTCGQF